MAELGVYRLGECFPGATSWGVKGSGPKSPERWTCSDCGGHRQLVVWKGFVVLSDGCLDCWMEARDRELSEL